MVSKKEAAGGMLAAGVVGYILGCYFCHLQPAAGAGLFSVSLATDKTTIVANDSGTTGTVTLTVVAVSPSAFPVTFTIYYRSPFQGTLINVPGSQTPSYSSQFRSFTPGTYVLYATCTDANGLMVASSNITITAV